MPLREYGVLKGRALEVRPAVRAGDPYPIQVAATLPDPYGVKVDGVSCTQAQARNAGWTIVF